MRPFDKQYFGLLREMVISQFKLKDQSTLLGLVWSFLHPLLMLGVLFVFFSSHLGQDIKHYPVYLLIGLIHYTHFSSSTGAGMVALSAMRSLTRDTVFPKEILVMSSVIANSIEFIISLLICILLAYFTGIKLSWASSMLPLILLLQMMMVLWVSFILSCCYVFVKDIGHIYQVFLRLLLFVTPIFYGSSFLGKGVARHIISFNPLMYLMNFSRTIIIDGEFFSARSFFIFASLNAVFIYLGLQVFRKCEGVFAERI